MANTTIEELLDLAYEVRDADQAGENTAFRVGGLLEEIIQYLSTVVDLTTLQAILEEYATVTGGGLIYWRHSRIICLASMGYDLDNIDGGNWNYTNRNGDIVFFPDGVSSHLYVVGTTGNYSVFPNVVYVNNHTGHAYLWKVDKMVEIRDSATTTIITYLSAPIFSQVAIGESYYYTSGNNRKLAIKLSADEVYSFDPDPKKIYVFLDTRQAMVWDSGNRQWISVGGSDIQIINDLITGGIYKALSAEMGVVIRREVNSLYESVNRLYGKLAAMAFWNAEDQADAAPTPMNWNLPKVSVAITNSIGTSAVIKRNGTAVGNSLQLDKGDELVLTVEAVNEDYEISNLAATVDGVDATLVNGTLTIEHVNANTAIVFSGTATQVWFTVNYDDVYSGGSLVRYGIQQGRAIVRETSTTNKGWATSGIINTNKPGTSIFPAGNPVNTKIFTSNPDPVNQSPGTTEASYIPVPSGKQYMHVRVIDPQYVYGPSYSRRNESPEEAALYDATKYRYNSCIAAYDSTVIGHTASGTGTIRGFISRGANASPDDNNYADHKDGEVNYKWDLYAKATDAGQQAGAVAYVKLALLAFYNDENSTQLATTDWLIMQAANGKQPVTIKYKFSND